MQILSLHKNKLQGPLPDQWAAPTAFQMLEELYLQNNTVRCCP